MIRVNGQEVILSNVSIDQCLSHMNLTYPHMVVEVNGEIVSKSKWSSHQLLDNDTVEVVHFVGGG